MTIRMIPLNQLVPSPANVRKTGASTGIEELAANIKALGLLQNLAVRPGPRGKFEVVAGGRRLAALRLLAKRKRIDSKEKIACTIVDGDAALEISLAENTIRLPMHPADQYEAFKALAESGKGLEEIAARFGTSPTIVRQRLKLASVSPKLIDLYRAEEMTLDHLMAFTVSEDHEAQEAAWFGQPDHHRRPDVIRRILMAAHVEADDARVAFVGLDTYKAAGGGIIRDLFQEQHEGYLTDPALLDRLVAAKLNEIAATVHAEGWKWVEVVDDLTYEMRNRFTRVHPERQPLSDEQQQELDRLAAEYDSLIEKHGEEPEPEIAKKIDALSERIDELSEGTANWRPEDIAIAGAFVSIGGSNGALVDRGFVRSEDRPKLKNGGSDADGIDEEPEKPEADNNGLSARLIEDLTVQRTAALRVELTKRSDIALVAILHALALPIFYADRHRAASCLDIRVTSRDIGRSAEGIAESEAGKRIAADRESWTAKLPTDPADLFGWLLAAENGTFSKLLAFCAATSIDAVRVKADRADCPRLGHADELARTLDLDMAQWWEPTRATYLGRVSKALVLTAVREGVSPAAARNLESLKKDKLTEKAEERLKGSKWLPPILRPSAKPEAEIAAAA